MSKEFFFSFFKVNDKIDISSAYITKLEKDIKDCKLLINTSSYSYGKVIYQNVYKFKEEIVISINNDLIDINDYVINNEGLVGTISKVYKNYAIVKLLNNNDNVIQVVINEKYGLLNNYIVKGIDNQSIIKVNDEVYTSNLGYHDEKILIGTVSKIIKDPLMVSDSYQITPAVNFNNLNYVLIISKGEK